MPRKPKTVQADSAQKTLWDILEGAEALSKEEVAASSKLDEGRMEYSPVDQTAKYVERAVRFEEVWETTIAKARERLLKVDPRELFMDFFDDLVTQAKAGGPKAGRYVVMLDLVGIQGFGMTKDMLSFEKAPKGGTGHRVRYRKDLVRQHIESHVSGEHFLNVLKADHSGWEDNAHLRIGRKSASKLGSSPSSLLQAYRSLRLEQRSGKHLPGSRGQTKIR
jgi:hypothetical protein